MLTRPLYRGEVVWNRTRKRDTWGVKRQRARPDGDVVRVERPELRIVPEPLWHGVAARLQGSRGAYLRATNGQLWGRPANGIESKYLLTGLATCGTCGGSLVIQSRAAGRFRGFAYRCSYHYYRGPTVCADGVLVPMRDTDQAVLEAVETALLTPRAVRQIVERAVARLEPTTDTWDTRRVTLAADLATVEAECQRYTAAVAQASDLRPLIEALRAREARRQALTTELAGLDALRRTGGLDVGRLESLILERIADWTGLMGRQVTQSRQLLRKLLVGRLVFTPEADQITFRGEASLGGILTARKAGVSPTGFELVFPDAIRCPLQNQRVGARHPSGSGTARKFGPGFQAVLSGRRARD